MKLVVLGAGESGVGAAILGKKKGWDVFVSDKGKIEEKYREILEKNNIQYEEEKHSLEKITTAQCVVKSPGIPDKIPLIQSLRQKNIPVISEIEFAFQYTKAKIIAITGSNGKTTTTSLVYHILKNAGVDVEMVGNIGFSLALQVACDDKKWYVAEISSFQLDGIKTFKPFVSVVLNITPDHLDRYDYKIENYAASKRKIYQNQSANDFYIYNDNDPRLKEYLWENPFVNKIPFSTEKSVENGAFLKNNTLEFNTDGQKIEIDTDQIPIKGKHNMQNVMSAVLASTLAGVSYNDIKKALLSFKAVKHRMEFIREKDGVKYINDSKATNVDSVFYALDSIKTPIVWIVGGQDKGNDYNQIRNLVVEKVKTIVCLGVDNSKIINFFKDTKIEIVETNNIDDAVRKGQRAAKQGYTVLLSPACASFDLFKNYQDRGEKFEQSVNKL